MTLHTSPNTVLIWVAHSPVTSKRFATVEDALWDMALSTARGRVSYYRRRIKRMETNMEWTSINSRRA